MASSYAIDVDALNTLITSLDSVRSALDAQSTAVSGLSSLLNAALTGSQVTTFEGTFSGWAASLGKIIGEMDSADTALDKLYTEVTTQLSTLNSIS